MSKASVNRASLAGDWRYALLQAHDVVIERVRCKWLSSVMFVVTSAAVWVHEVEVKSGNAKHRYCRNNNQTDD
jgi:hypothetical protein